MIGASTSSRCVMRMMFANFDFEGVDAPHLRRLQRAAEKDADFEKASSSAARRSSTTRAKT